MGGGGRVIGRHRGTITGPEQISPAALVCPMPGLKGKKDHQG